MVKIENRYSEDLMHCEQNKSVDGSSSAPIWFPGCALASYHENMRAPPPAWRVFPVWTELSCVAFTFLPVVLGRFSSPPVSSSTSKGLWRFMISAAASIFSSGPLAKTRTPPCRTP